MSTPPSSGIGPKSRTGSYVELPTTIWDVLVWTSMVTKSFKWFIWYEAPQSMIQDDLEDKARAWRAWSFPIDEEGGWGEDMWCCYMESSKASNYFQHLETRCPSLPKKLWGPHTIFLVLKEDSPN